MRERGRERETGSEIDMGEWESGGRDRHIER